MSLSVGQAEQMRSLRRAARALYRERWNPNAWRAHARGLIKLAETLLALPDCTYPDPPPPPPRSTAPTAPILPGEASAAAELARAVRLIDQGKRLIDEGVAILERINGP